MKWVEDSSGRFQRRPYYSTLELDNECEQIVTQYLAGKYGTVSFPLSTDDLSVMVERDTSDLDLYADLAVEGEDVEGLTDFFTDKKPSVKISKKLSLDNLKAHRLRTTLAHEYAHVKFHHFLWDMSLKAENAGNFWKKLSRQRHRLEDLRQKSVITVNPPHLLTAVTGPRCKNTSIIDAPVKDWMEWQAGYAAGALLMPVTASTKNVQALLKKWGGEQITSDSEQGRELISNTAAAFDVSMEAAAARLSKLGFFPGTPVDDSIPVKDTVSFTR
jgi:Zn-dependent peptidase ImmA (M78 family)